MCFIQYHAYCIAPNFLEIQNHLEMFCHEIFQADSSSSDATKSRVHNGIIKTTQSHENLKLYGITFVLPFATTVKMKDNG